MLLFFGFLLQFALIVLKVVGLSTIGWLATFAPAIVYVGFVATIYVTIIAVAAIVFTVASVKALRGR